MKSCGLNGKVFQRCMTAGPYLRGEGDPFNQGISHTLEHQGKTRKK